MLGDLNASKKPILHGVALQRQTGWFEDVGKAPAIYKIATRAVAVLGKSSCDEGIPMRGQMKLDEPRMC